MNPLDRLRGIIARDIDGRPLRVGAGLTAIPQSVDYPVILLDQF